MAPRKRKSKSKKSRKPRRTKSKKSNRSRKTKSKRSRKTKSKRSRKTKSKRSRKSKSKRSRKSKRTRKRKSKRSSKMKGGGGKWKPFAVTGSSSDSVKQFVLFHSDTCPHCTSFLPTWNKFVKKYNGVYNGVHLLDFEYHSSPDVFSLNNIEFFPTMRYYPVSMTVPANFIVYDGARQLKNIISFLDTIV